MEASALQAPARLTGISLSAPLLRLRSDDQLVALFRAGSEEAFRVIHDRYQQRLFAYMRQMLSGSRQDAEDALQDVFLRAHAALRADGRPISLRAWLYRVAHNRCIDQLRRPVPLPLEGLELVRPAGSDPLAEAERREDLRRLVADVRRLPAQQRSVLLMRELEGASYADLADAHNVSIAAVKSLLVRARIGLVRAAEARDVACVEIRTDLAAAHDRGVRATGRARRHMRDCAACRDYRSALRTTSRELAGIVPGGPLASLAQLLGLSAGSGGAAAGSSAAAGGGAAASGGAVAGGGMAAATVCKVAAVVCSTVVAAGGAVEVKQLAGGSQAPASRGAPVTATAASASSGATPATSSQGATRDRAAGRGAVSGAAGAQPASNSAPSSPAAGNSVVVPEDNFPNGIAETPPADNPTDESPSAGDGVTDPAPAGGSGDSAGGDPGASGGSSSGEDATPPSGTDATATAPGEIQDGGASAGAGSSTRSGAPG